MYRCQISPMHYSAGKTPQKRTLKISLHLLVNLKSIRALAPPMFCIEIGDNGNHLYPHRFQASYGALRSAKHGHRDVVIRVRGCRMTRDSRLAFWSFPTIIKSTFPRFVGNQTMIIREPRPMIYINLNQLCPVVTACMTRHDRS